MDVVQTIRKAAEMAHWIRSSPLILSRVVMWFALGKAAEQLFYSS